MGRVSRAFFTRFDMPLPMALSLSSPFTLGMSGRASRERLPFYASFEVLITNLCTTCVYTLEPFNPSLGAFVLSGLTARVVTNWHQRHKKTASEFEKVDDDR